MHIELAGYTDNVGSQAALLKLSEDRVNGVINYLASREVDRHRLTGKGYGSANPIVRNDTEEHRKMNRRVEFKITKKWRAVVLSYLELAVMRLAEFLFGVTAIDDQLIDGFVGGEFEHGIVDDGFADGAQTAGS